MCTSCLLHTTVCLAFLCMQTVSRELEEEALLKETEADKLLKALAAASTAAERRRLEELKAKDQQIAELQVQSWLMGTTY